MMSSSSHARKHCAEGCFRHMRSWNFKVPDFSCFLSRNLCLAHSSICFENIACCCFCKPQDAIIPPPSPQTPRNANTCKLLGVMMDGVRLNVQFPTLITKLSCRRFPPSSPPMDSGSLCAAGKVAWEGLGVRKPSPG